MRIWTIHPHYLDAKGLVALWREGLLAQKVLQGGTKGYRHHPQLTRFRQLPDPAAGVAAYLAVVWDEATKRGYAFDAAKVGSTRFTGQIAETTGQLQYEWEHLLSKLQRRDPARFAQHQRVRRPEPHPLFTLVPGQVRDWERLTVA